MVFNDLRGGDPANGGGGFNGLRAGASRRACSTSVFEARIVPVGNRTFNFEVNFITLFVFDFVSFLQAFVTLLSRAPRFDGILRL
jgi:hypothetical protein